MIQRQQTLWLLLSAVCAFLTFYLPFYNGTVKMDVQDKTPYIDAGGNLFLLLLTGIIILTAIITIFLYKDRKKQIKFAIAGAIVSVIVIALYFVEMKRFDSGGISISALFSFAVLIGFVMAARGIWKDEKLVKSLDKLR
jgi:hypothetical protein